MEINDVELVIDNISLIGEEFDENGLATKVNDEKIFIVFKAAIPKKLFAILDQKNGVIKAKLQTK